MKKFTKKIKFKFESSFKTIDRFCKNLIRKNMKNKFLIIVSSILATMIVLVTTLIGIFYLSSNIPNSVTFLKNIT